MSNHRPTRFSRPATVARMCLEALESRCLLTAVSWDGGAGSVFWNDANNWSNNQVPTAADDVTIGSNVLNLRVDAPGAVANSVNTSSPINFNAGTGLQTDSLTLNT